MNSDHTSSREASGSLSSTRSPRVASALPLDTSVDVFAIREPLGAGSYGITYRAWDTELERDVAIKEYFPRELARRAENGIRVEPATPEDTGDYERGLTRFIGEARTLAQFSAANIVRVLRYLETNGTAYLVMNLEQGVSLRHVVRRVRQLSTRQIEALALHLLSALQAVHDKGFLHRDVKPANVLVRSGGPPVLIDFGAARLALSRERHENVTSLTPGYAPVEQYSQDDAQGPWTDLYGLGATLYYCMMKMSPPNATDRLLAQNAGLPDPVAAGLEQLGETYGDDLCDLVAWLLQPRPEDRPRRAKEVISTLRALRQARRESAARVPARHDAAANSSSEAAAARYSGGVRDGATTRRESAETVAAEEPRYTGGLRGGGGQRPARAAERSGLSEITERLRATLTGASSRRATVREEVAEGEPTKSRRYSGSVRGGSGRMRGGN